MKMLTESPKFVEWHLSKDGRNIGTIWVEIGTSYDGRREIAHAHGADRLVLKSADDVREADPVFCHECYHNHINA